MNEDKQVGELWRQHAKLQFPPVSTSGVSGCTCVTCSLIHKLIDERANIHYRPGLIWNEAIEHACRDFGIDPKDWPA